MSGLREALEEIRERHGILTPEIVVEEARPVESPLHDRFEWNDDVAAENWRRDQAHRLITSVRISYVAGDGPRDVRAFHAVRQGDKFDYTPAREVAVNPVAREIVLREMERQFRELERRYSHFAEWSELIVNRANKLPAA